MLFIIVKPKQQFSKEFGTKKEIVLSVFQLKGDQKVKFHEKFLMIYLLLTIYEQQTMKRRK